jgi:TRAP-type mannitol/chloroaromatic compound transport system substrate-binding protein
MDRRSALKNAGILGVLAAGTAPAVHAQAAIRWRLASSFPKSLDTIYGASETFVKKVGELSGGKFVISSHAAGELMPPFGVVDGVQNGTVEVAHTAPYYFFGKDETFALGCAIPFGLNSRQMTSWMYQGNGLKLMREFYKQYNIVNFPGGNTGVQMGGWYRKEVKSVADIKGLKFRVGGFAGKVIERMGGVPQNIPGGEIYQALEKGTIDAAEWIGPYDDQKLGFNKVAPFYYYPGWWEGGPQLDIFVNDKAYNSLSAENKAIVECAAAFAALPWGSTPARVSINTFSSSSDPLRLSTHWECGDKTACLSNNSSIWVGNTFTPRTIIMSSLRPVIFSNRRMVRALPGNKRVRSRVR